MTNVYVRSVDGVNIDNYPFGWKELRTFYHEIVGSDFDKIAEGLDDVYKVNFLPQPSYDAQLEYLSQDLEPYKETDGKWYVGYQVYAYSPDELFRKSYNPSLFRETQRGQ